VVDTYAPSALTEAAPWHIVASNARPSEEMSMQGVGSINRQRGATFLGILTIVAILGFAVYAGIRLVPLYKEYMDVAKALSQTAKDLGGAATPADIRKSLERRWEVEDIKSLQPKDIEINRVGNSTTLRAQYRAETEFFSNISLVVDFDKVVTMGSSDGP
jgi:Domain of unknown function (DUF4845)